MNLWIAEFPAVFSSLVDVRSLDIYFFSYEVLLSDFLAAKGPAYCYYFYNFIAHAACISIITTLCSTACYAYLRITSWNIDVCTQFTSMVSFKSMFLLRTCNELLKCELPLSNVHWPATCLCILSFFTHLLVSLFKNFQTIHIGLMHFIYTLPQFFLK